MDPLVRNSIILISRFWSKPFRRDAEFRVCTCNAEALLLSLKLRIGSSIGSRQIVHFPGSACFLDTDAGHIAIRAENTAFASCGQHLGPTRGAGMANPS